MCFWLFKEFRHLAWRRVGPGTDPPPRAGWLAAASWLAGCLAELARWLADQRIRDFDLKIYPKHKKTFSFFVFLLLEDCFWCFDHSKNTKKLKVFLCFWLFSENLPKRQKNLRFFCVFDFFENSGICLGAESDQAPGSRLKFLKKSKTQKNIRFFLCFW